MMRMNCFITTVRTQYEYLLHSHALAKPVSHLFDVALPAGGVIAVPFIGLILHNFSTIFVLGLLVVIATIIGVVRVLPFNWAAYTNIALFVYTVLCTTQPYSTMRQSFGIQHFWQNLWSHDLLCGSFELISNCIGCGDTQTCS